MEQDADRMASIRDRTRRYRHHERIGPTVRFLRPGLDQRQIRRPGQILGGGGNRDGQQTDKQGRPHGRGMGQKAEHQQKDGPDKERFAPQAFG